MAVQAARGARHADLVPQSVVLCSTTAPFADRDVAGLLAAALDLPESTETLNLGASMRAGTSGLINALRRGGGAPALLVASDARLTRAGSPQEMTYGDAAAALLLGPATPQAPATVLAARSLGSDFVDHYRMSGADFDYALEERWVRDESLLQLIPRAVSELLSAAGVDRAAVRHLALPTGAATARRIADACGLQAAQRDERVLAECGDAGAALPLLLLAGALEAAAPGDLDRVDRSGPGSRCPAAPRRGRAARAPARRCAGAGARGAELCALFVAPRPARCRFRHARRTRSAHRAHGCVPQTRGARRLQGRPLRALRHGSISAGARVRQPGLPGHGYSGRAAARRFAGPGEILHRRLAGLCRRAHPISMATSNSRQAATCSWSSPTSNPAS